ncbi:hypothetical protein MBLNU459_g2795t1 [Dothideomycetes sp. NU459]
MFRICYISTSGAAATIRTDLDRVRIHPKPLPGWNGDCSFSLPFSLPENEYSFLVRDGDEIKFHAHSATLRLDWNPALTHDVEDVEVKSSGLANVKTESQPRYGNGTETLGAEVGETQDDMQHNVYSTSREELTPTPASYGPEIIQETPSHVRSELRHPIDNPKPERSLDNHEADDSAQVSQAAERDGPGTPEPQAEVDPSEPAAVDDMPERSLENSTMQLEGLDTSNIYVEISLPHEEEVDSAELQAPDFNRESTEDDQPDQEVSVGSPSKGMSKWAEASTSGLPQARTAKRKAKVTGSYAREHRTKRTKVTSDDALAKDPATPIGGTPLISQAGTQSGRRTSPRVTQTSFGECEEYTGPSPKILFPTESAILSKRKALMKFLTNQKAIQTEDYKTANFFCVAKGELKTTAKLLHSLTMSKHIVTEDWVVQSSKAGRLLDPDKFVPEPLQATIHLDRSQLFAGQVLYISPKLRADYKKGWDEIHSILKQAGNPEIINAPVKKFKESERARVTVFLGSEVDDKDAKQLQEGNIFHKKDLISGSIVSGTLALDKEEFLLGITPSTSPSNNKARKGKK